MCMDEVVRQRIKNIRDMIESKKEQPGCPECEAGQNRTNPFPEMASWMKSAASCLDEVMRDFSSDFGLSEPEQKKETQKESIFLKNDRKKSEESRSPRRKQCGCFVGKGRCLRSPMSLKQKEASREKPLEQEDQDVSTREKTEMVVRLFQETCCQNAYEFHKNNINEAFSRLNKVFLEHDCSGYVSVVFYNDEGQIGIEVSLCDDLKENARTRKKLNAVRGVVDELDTALKNAAKEHLYFRFGFTENGYEFTDAGHTIPDGLQLI